MSDLNFDANTINKLKDMMNKGELNDVISQISPEMMQNFSSMMKNNNTSSQSEKQNSNQYSNQSQNSDNNSKQSSSQNGGFDFSNIDMNTILKMKSVMEKMNNSNDPRANLLSSLKPYLRDGKKEKLDQYATLLKMANVAELMKNDKKEPNNNA